MTALKEWDIDGFQARLSSTRFDRHAANVPGDRRRRPRHEVRSARRGEADEGDQRRADGDQAGRPSSSSARATSDPESAVRQHDPRRRLPPANMRRNRVANREPPPRRGRLGRPFGHARWNFKASPAGRRRASSSTRCSALVQYSVMLRDAPPEHRAVIEKWIRFSRTTARRCLKAGSRRTIRAPVSGDRGGIGRRAHRRPL